MYLLIKKNIEIIWLIVLFIILNIKYKLFGELERIIAHLCNGIFSRRDYSQKQLIKFCNLMGGLSLI